MRTTRIYAVAVAGLVLLAGIVAMAALTDQSPLAYWWLTAAVAGYALLLTILYSRSDRRRQAEATDLRLFSSIVEHATDIIYITDIHGTIEYVNPGFEQLTGYSRTEAIGRTPALLKSGEHEAAFYQRLWLTILQGRQFRELFINRRKDGSIYFEEKQITPVLNSANEVTHFISTGKDVTERVQGQQQLHYLAHFDTLTGLANRAHFRARLQEALARTRRSEKLLALMFLDLDNFKRINDSLGHDVGDALLKAVAERLQDNIRETDSIGRLGGDEFTVILENISHVNNSTTIAQKLVQAINQPFRIGAHTLHVSVSIGITLYPLDDAEAELLIKNADMAMYQAKELGRNGFQYYSADLTRRVDEHMRLESELRLALERGEFVLHYQPIVDLRSGRVRSAEVLLRWQHPQRGLISPNDFIPVLEDSGLIMPVTEWVLRKSAEQISGCLTAGVPMPALAVNITAGCFHGNGITKCTGNALASCGDHRGELILEVTESVLINDTQHVLGLMRDLKSTGIRIALDDFGTGQSSLSHLRKFPIDVVKIDRDFVRELPHNQDDASMVSAIIAMSHGLGKTVVAEGVETPAQLEFLRALGCDSIQGFLYSRPLPIDKLIPLMARPLLPDAQAALPPASSPPANGSG